MSGYHKVIPMVVFTIKQQKVVYLKSVCIVGFKGKLIIIIMATHLIELIPFETKYK